MSKEANVSQQKLWLRARSAATCSAIAAAVCSLISCSKPVPVPLDATDGTGAAPAGTDASSMADSPATGPALPDVSAPALDSFVFQDGCGVAIAAADVEYCSVFVGLPIGYGLAASATAIELVAGKGGESGPEVCIQTFLTVNTLVKVHAPYPVAGTGCSEVEIPNLYYAVPGCGPIRSGNGATWCFRRKDVGSGGEKLNCTLKFDYVVGGNDYCAYLQATGAEGL